LTEEYEQVLFRSYRLDPAKVAFLRARLKNVAPYPIKELEKRRRKLLSLYAKIESLQNETRQISHEVPPHVYCPWWEGGSFSYDRPGYLNWDLLEKKWGEGVADTDALAPFSYGTIKNEYRQRPNEKPALRMWDSFVVAANSAPEVMVRVMGKGFSAAFRDATGKLVPLGYEFLQMTKAATVGTE